MKDQPLERMIAKIYALWDKYPDHKIPLDECPILSTETFLDVCERIVALEEAYTVLLNERARRIDNL